ncbi:interferon-induced, double-stranded RNA-activated protein kinase isoform X1 [Tachyglossus aculeatus]|uniref:interferon-induced, double-stranded RNA-activated protein kinase isoform X1 n=1 Tax=Tachyglossus aculeatus TaxID=9261 RepID=UPI0018F35780|nr:interferon-induced, double-stranded RNA-activated protein kinase isoform X1 [Tachyglossus aculeatus]
MANAPEPRIHSAHLHEYCQKKGLKLVYRDISKTGPDHNLQFTVQVIIEGREFPEASGSSKKKAKDAAAKLALKILTKDNQIEKSLASPELKPPPSESTSESSSAYNNYMGLVNQWAQVEGLHLDIDFSHKYDNVSMLPSSSCVLTVGKYQATGDGKNKQKAKQKAAELVYEQIKLDKASVSGGSSIEFRDSGPPHRNGFSEDLSERKMEDLSSDDFSLTKQDTGFLPLRRNLQFSHKEQKPGRAWGKSCREILPESQVPPLRTPISGERKCQTVPWKPKRPLAAKFGLGKSENNEVKLSADKHFNSTYEGMSLISSGGFGQVFKARSRLDKQYYAIKRVKFNEGSVVREVKALAKLSHEHIVRYYSCWEGLDFDPEKSNNNSSSMRCLYIVMQLCEKGTLNNWIDRRRNKEMDKTLSLNIFQQITSGVEYIHSQTLIHRDLKPENIFVVDENNIKIGDFGLATSLIAKEKTVGRGTERYMSPEQRLSTKYGTEVDIFALGLILFELLHICPTASEVYRIWDKIRVCEFPVEFVDRHPKEKKLLQKLLSQKPEQRPKASEILIVLKHLTEEDVVTYTC